MKLTRLLFVLLFCFVSTTLFATIEDVREESFDAQSGGKLLLKTDRGSIKIKTHSSESIDVKIKIRIKTNDEELADDLLDKFEIEYDSDGKNLEIEARYDKEISNWFSNGDRNKLHAEFIITVPEDFNLNLATSGGSIMVDDINGYVKAGTSGGSLKFGNVTGDIDGNTSGGSIQVNDCDGNVEVNTSGGGISIDKVKGYVVASTSGGGITVEEVYGEIKAVTSGGSIYAAIMDQPKNDCVLKTSGGSITVKISSDINVDLDASTSGGSVNSDFQMKFRGSIKRNKLQGELNNGGPELYLRTSGGSINLKEV